ncbi:chymotrypsin-2-like [Phymastichus coffea]|uniref:chymotrypsin-2-like n=1 Tax=Phymastichus coffea TaxID=108790 RepID=UPI00273C3A54|nr:chymotrypsin-2-like [Phymastichus coffea]
MKKFTLVLLLSWIIGYSRAVAGQLRIMNGSPADVGQFPYQAYITDDLTGACGASIIHKRWLLTAAHCRLYASHAYAIVGAIYKTGLNGTRYNYEKFIKHSNFVVSQRRNRVSNDIALIRLSKDIQFTKHVQPIKLATDPWNDYANVSATLSGWGIRSPRGGLTSSRLYYASLKVIGENECGQLWRTVMDNQICTGGSIHQPDRTAACIGDSGGPLVYENRQIGVASYGHGLCGVYLPDVYTRVSRYLSWIEKQLQFHSDKLSW